MAGGGIDLGFLHDSPTASRWRGGHEAVALGGGVASPSGASCPAAGVSASGEFSASSPSAASSLSSASAESPSSASATTSFGSGLHFHSHRTGNRAHDELKKLHDQLCVDKSTFSKLATIGGNAKLKDRRIVALLPGTISRLYAVVRYRYAIRACLTEGECYVIPCEEHSPYGRQASCPACNRYVAPDGQPLSIEYGTHGLMRYWGPRYWRVCSPRDWEAWLKIIGPPKTGGATPPCASFFNPQTAGSPSAP
jgi:hypothetical protein